MAADLGSLSYHELRGQACSLIRLLCLTPTIKSTTFGKLLTVRSTHAPADAGLDLEGEVIDSNWNQIVDK